MPYLCIVFRRERGCAEAEPAGVERNETGNAAVSQEDARDFATPPNKSTATPAGTVRLLGRRKAKSSKIIV